jgi:hypothetical protein
MKLKKNKTNIIKNIILTKKSFYFIINMRKKQTVKPTVIVFIVKRLNKRPAVQEQFI